VSRAGGAGVLAAMLALSCVLHGCGGGSPSPTAAAIPPLEPALPDNVRVVAVGDILLDRGVADRIQSNGLDSLLPVVAPQLQRADIAFGNLECPIATVGPHDPSATIFRADPATVAVLVQGGFDMLSVANNHTLNSGPAALIETLDHLDAVGIGYVGAAREEEHGSDPAFLQVRDLRIGFLAYTDLPFECESYSKVDEDLTRLRQQVAAARADCDVLLVSFHWGEMDQTVPTPRQVEVAHASIDAGADAVLGHHPHVLQGAEMYQGKPILYSMGNLVFDRRTTAEGESGLFDLCYREGGGWQVCITPVSIPLQRYGPEYAAGSEGAAILEGFATLSQDLGTTVDVSQGWGEW
jgi:hypothetical protein